MGDVLKTIGGGLKSGLEGIFTHKYADRVQKEIYQAQLFGPVIYEYLTNPKSITPDDAGLYAIDQYTKLLPKGQQDSFRQFIHAKLSARLPKPPDASGDGSGPPIVAPVSPDNVPPPTPVPGSSLAPPPGAGAGELSELQSMTGAQDPSQEPMPLVPAGVPGPPIGGLGGTLPPPPSTVTPPPVIPNVSSPGTGFAMPIGPDAAGIMRKTPMDLYSESAPVVRAERDARATFLAQQPWFDRLTPRQQAILVSEQNLAPEMKPSNLPGMVHGKSISDVSQDAFGNAIDENAMYRVRLNPDGSREYFPEVGSSTSKIVPDQGSPTGFSLAFFDRTGHEISRTPGATPPTGYGTTTSSHTGEKIANIGNEVVKLPVSGTTTRTKSPYVPGKSSVLAPPPGSPNSASKGKGAAAVSSPASATASSTDTSAPTLPKGARVLGNSPSFQRRLEENPLTPQAQKIVEENKPVLQQIDRALKILEPMKGQNTPLQFLGESLGYKGGLSTQNAKLITNLNLGRVQGAARVLKGASRSMQALELAAQHLPNLMVDSPKLAYDKLLNIRQNLTDIDNAARTEGQKYPGMKRPPGSNNLAPPPATSNTVKVLSPDGKTTGFIPIENLEKAIGRGFKQVP